MILIMPAEAAALNAWLADLPLPVPARSRAERPFSDALHQLRWSLHYIVQDYG
jgi:hypothetical protein